MMQIELFERCKTSQPLPNCRVLLTAHSEKYSLLPILLGNLRNSWSIF